jgi:hypothetical protein
MQEAFSFGKEQRLLFCSYTVAFVWFGENFWMVRFNLDSSKQMKFISRDISYF